MMTKAQKQRVLNLVPTNGRKLRGLPDDSKSDAAFDRAITKVIRKVKSGEIKYPKGKAS